VPAIVPNLWFDTRALEAAEFYCGIFPNSSVNDETRYTEAGPGDQARTPCATGQEVSERSCSSSTLSAVVRDPRRMRSSSSSGPSCASRAPRSVR
jgi:predicted 3-demethylubiquinone-9 3-methyltransferase (glyoxalase superfamily)